MRKLVLALTLSVGLLAPATAFASPETLTVVGVPDGGLAAAALIARDYQAAEAKLSAAWPDAFNDPARLINLGNAYAGLGRIAQAREAYRAAAFAPKEMLVMADGSEAPARDVARKALRRMDVALAMK